MNSMTSKKAFVEGFGKLLAEHCRGIKKLEYLAPGKIYNEEVVITWTDPFGEQEQTVNVSMDSIPALIRDVAKVL